MSKLNRIRYRIIGKGNECPKCGKEMERREHNEKPTKTWFYTKWDVCTNYNCNMTVQHYDEFKSVDWQESERQNNFIKSI